MYSFSHANRAVILAIALLHLGHQLLLRLSIDKLDRVRDLVVALVEVEDEEGLDGAEVVLLLDEQSRFPLFNVLDVLQDLDLFIRISSAYCRCPFMTCGVSWELLTLTGFSP